MQLHENLQCISIPDTPIFLYWEYWNYGTVGSQWVSRIDWGPSHHYAYCLFQFHFFTFSSWVCISEFFTLKWSSENVSEILMYTNYNTNNQQANEYTKDFYHKYQLLVNLQHRFSYCELFMIPGRLINTYYTSSVDIPTSSTSIYKLCSIITSRCYTNSGTTKITFVWAIGSINASETSCHFTCFLI